MLTDVAIRQARAKDKPYKISDSGGLYLLVKSAGKYWRMNYRFAGKQKTFAIGVYPLVSLVAARKERDEARELLAKDIAHPSPKPSTSRLYALWQKLPSRW